MSGIFRLEFILADFCLVWFVQSLNPLKHMEMDRKGWIVTSFILKLALPVCLNHFLSPTTRTLVPFVHQLHISEREWGELMERVREREGGMEREGRDNWWKEGGREGKKERERDRGREKERQRGREMKGEGGRELEREREREGEKLLMISHHLFFGFTDLPSRTSVIPSRAHTTIQMANRWWVTLPSFVLRLFSVLAVESLPTRRDAEIW